VPGDRDDERLFDVEAVSPAPVVGGPVDKTFRRFDPGQQFLLPPSLDEWLPQGHLARFVAGLVTAPHAWHLVGHPWNVKGVNPTWHWSVPVTSASTLRRRCAPSSVPVLVVVALVLGVPVLVMQVVDVIAVLHCLVAATFSVYMISMLVRAVLF